MKSFKLAYVWEYILEILPYLKVTYSMLFASLLFGCLFGILIAKAKLSKKGVWRRIGFGYTTLMRCIPTIVLLFLVYYGLPKLLNQIGIQSDAVSTFVYVVITFVLFGASELSEVMRSSYEAVPKGQLEAGLSIGMTNWQTFWRIIFPQALKISIPNLGNSVILLFKEGSLAYLIGFIDIMGKANALQGNTMGLHALEIYAAISIIYWVCSVIFEQLIRLYERVVLKRETNTTKNGKKIGGQKYAV